MIRHSSFEKKVRIANNRVYTSNGEKVQEVSYFDIEVWGVVAENCAKYLSKGNGIIVEGRLKQDRWEKEGKTQSRVRIVAMNVHFMPRKNSDQSAQPQQIQQPQQAQQAQPAVVPSQVQAPAPEPVAWDE